MSYFFFQYCNAMSSFYLSDLFSMCHVVWSYVQNGIMPADRLFCSSMRSEKNLKETERGTERDGHTAGPRPFILKGLFTMVISAWGTGYNARYQWIKDRCVQQFSLSSSSWLAFFSRVWNVLKFKPWWTLVTPWPNEQADVFSTIVHFLFLEEISFLEFIWYVRYKSWNQCFYSCRCVNHV